MPVLREKTSWSRPRKTRSSELTLDEQAHAKAAVKFLRERFGSYLAMAKATGLSFALVKHTVKPKARVSAGVALRIARVAGAPLEAILSGAWPTPGLCPRCGRG